MNLLDRYIFKSVLSTCLAAVGFLTFLFMLANAFRDLLGFVASGQMELGTLFTLLGLLIPFSTYYALPAGILTGVLLTLGRLSADGEITAMRTAGVSLARLTRPIVVLGVLGLALGLYINFSAMPQTRLQYQLLRNDAIQRNFLRFIVPRTFVRDISGVVVYIGEKEGAVLKDFWVWQLDKDQRVKQVIRAETGRFEYEAEENVLILTLHRAQIESRNEDQPEDFSLAPLVGTFDKTEMIRLPLDKVVRRSTVQQKLKWMTYDQLRAEEARLGALTPTIPSEKLKEHRRDKMKVQLILQEKLQNALAILTFALIGVPLGIKVSRRETSANLGVAVGLALGHYFLTFMVNLLDRHPEYRPDLLYFVPNLVFLALALWLFRRVDKR